MSTNPLFRIEVLEKRRAPRLGSIMLARPISFTYLVIGALVSAAAVITFITFGSYAMRSTATGQLMPINGVIRVMSPSSGVVLEKRIAEGQRVTKGEIIFVLSGERQYGENSFAQASISAQIRSRQRSLNEELSRTTALNRDQSDALKQQIKNLSASTVKWQEQIEAQSSRVAIYAKTALRFQSLYEQNFVSFQQVQDKQAALAEENVVLHSLQRELTAAARDLADAQNNLEALPLRQSMALAAIQRNLNSAEQELIESEGRRTIVITAPVSGTATALTAEVGQTVEPNRSLSSIVPGQSLLEARLFVSSSAIGFIKKGDEVMLRYQAFPYQKFGHAKGWVESVSRAAATSAELGGPVVLPGISATDPVYSVIVRLAAQDILAYGKREPLMTGLLVDADILHEQRHLYEWIMDPLYTITGRI